MKCESVREKLTAYLDGELEGERGSAIRGHLRGCDACRAIASDEATLRDGLRSLPPLDPPASLWAGVQARLAAEEVRDAEKPAWRRALSWLKPRATHIGLAGAALAAAVVLIVMKVQRGDGSQPTVGPVVEVKSPVIGPEHQERTPPAPIVDDTMDMTAALAAEHAQITDSYAQTTRELLAIAKDARTQWPADRQREFDAQLDRLQKKVALATDERPRRDAYRKLIRYLQGAVIRDDVALASIVPAGRPEPGPLHIGGAP